MTTALAFFQPAVAASELRRAGWQERPDRLWQIGAYVMPLNRASDVTLWARHACVLLRRALERIVDEARRVVQPVVDAINAWARRWLPTLVYSLGVRKQWRRRRIEAMLARYHALV